MSWSGLLDVLRGASLPSTHQWDWFKKYVANNAPNGAGWFHLLFPCFNMRPAFCSDDQQVKAPAEQKWKRCKCVAPVACGSTIILNSLDDAWLFLKSSGQWKQQGRRVEQKPHGNKNSPTRLIQSLPNSSSDGQFVSGAGALRWECSGAALARLSSWRWQLKGIREPCVLWWKKKGEGSLFNERGHRPHQALEIITSTLNDTQGWNGSHCNIWRTGAMNTQGQDNPLPSNRTICLADV